jgi:predicted TPR repeat methyltransferase
MTTNISSSDAPLEQSRTLFFAGIAHFEQRQFGDACRCFELALQLAPGRLSIVGNLGITLFHLQRPAEAAPLLQQATLADPTYAEAWACLGLAHEALGRWPEMVNALSQAVRLQEQPASLWLALGMGQLRLGQAKGALASLNRAVEIDPTFVPAWSELGSLLRELKRFDESATCFEKALALGGDSELNRYYLASVRSGPVPAAAPRSYVEALFDDYARDFEKHLVGQLGYRAHEILLEPLLASGRRYRHVLDLGCGTGLCGSLIAPQADRIDGIDLSAAMLAEARKTSVYHDLVHADIGTFLAGQQQPVDLVLAADVFIYVGDLSSVLQSLRRILAPDGCLAFTIEPSFNDSDLQLLPSLRYGHSEAYVRRLAAESGFRILSIQKCPLRYDQTIPVQGLYVYLG